MSRSEQKTRAPTKPLTEKGGARSRFFTKHSDTNLRLELSRVMRESAAVQIKQYPTPTGNDAIRILAAIFAAFSVACLIMGLVEHGD